MSYNRYLKYMNELGLTEKTLYDYKNKTVNVNTETERMLNRSIMMFQWHGLPETIPSEMLEQILQTQGYAIIGQYDGKLYAFYGSLGGELDEYYRPTQAIVNNPYLKLNKVWEIDTDCVVIRNDLMCQGLLPLYNKFNTFQIESDISLMLALVNLRVQAYISASDDKAIQSAQKMIDNLYDGELSVIADDVMLQSLKISPIAKYQDLNNIKELKQYLTGQLYNEIGLATNYNLKKERVTQAEVELNTDNLYPFVDNMYDRRKEGIEQIYNLFGASWDIEYNSSWDYRLYNGEPMTTKGDNENDDITNNNVGDSGDIISDINMEFASDDKGNDTITNDNTEKVESAIVNSDNVSDIDDSVINDNIDTNDTDILSDDNDKTLNELPDDVLIDTEKNIVELANDIADVIIEMKESENNDKIK